MNVLYLLISYGDLYSNFACSIVLQISCIIEKIKKFYDAKNFFSRKQHFQNVNVVCNIICHIIIWL